MRTAFLAIVLAFPAAPAYPKSPDPEEREAYRRGYEEGFARGDRKSLEVTYRCARLEKAASANEHRTIYLDC